MQGFLFRRMQGLFRYLQRQLQRMQRVQQLFWYLLGNVQWLFRQLYRKLHQLQQYLHRHLYWYLHRTVQHCLYSRSAGRGNRKPWAEYCRGKPHQGQ